MDKPFSFRTRELRRDSFRLQCPLIEILQLRDAGAEVNKFYGGQMTGDVLQYVQKYLFDRQLYSLAGSYGAQHGQLDHRVFLRSIVPILQALVEREVSDEEVSHSVKADTVGLDEGSDSDSDDCDEAKQVRITLVLD